MPAITQALDGYKMAVRGINQQVDPGDAGTINVAKSPCVIALDCASGNETRTLSDPDGAGLLLQLTLANNDGTDITVTADSVIDQSNNVDIAFSTVTDTILLTSIHLTRNTYRWQVVFSEGVTLAS